MDFDEQLGLEDEHLQSFEDEVFMDAPTDLEPVAAQVVLPKQENAEDDVVETMDKSPVRQRSPSSDVEVAEGLPLKHIRWRQNSTAVEFHRRGPHA